MDQDKQPESETERAIDVSTKSSRAMLRRAVENGWPIGDSVKAATVSALLRALGVADKAKHARNVSSIARTLATLVGQNQADQHLEIKVTATEEARGLDLPDDDAGIRVLFPIRGPHRADLPVDDDTDGEASDG